MDTPTTNRRTGRRWRAPLAALAVGVVTATGAGPLLGSGTSASAIPICNDPAGCGPTSPFNPNPIPFPWNAKVALLDQSSGGVNRVLDGQWLRLGPFSTQISGSGTVLWSNPEKTVGTLRTNTAPAAGAPIGFRVLESGSSGRACRLPLQSLMPPSNQTLRILAAPTTSKSAAQLSALAAGFKGRVEGNPGGAEVTITSTQLDSRADGLFLTLKGRIWKDIQFPLPNVDASFTYKVLLHPRVANSTRVMSSVATVTADKGDLDLDGDGWTDDVEIWAGGDAEPDFRAAVSTKATSAFNDAIAADPSVSWFTSLGYTLSARRVTTSTAGFALDGAFCRLGS